MLDLCRLTLLLALLSTLICVAYSSVELVPVRRMESNKTEELIAVWKNFVEHAGRRRLKKTVFSNGKRLLFVAGLEGTGHHAWKAIMKPCVERTGCRGAVNLTQTLFKANSSAEVLHGLFASHDVTSVHTVLDETVKAFANFASLPDKSALYILGLAFSKQAGMMSYPNFDLDVKALNHPDLFIIALLCETFGIDLRVVVLQRHAESILVSTKLRKFGGDIEERILIENAAAMYAELESIDPEFYHCVGYEQMKHLSGSERQELSTFLHPHIVGPIFDLMLEKVVYSNKSSEGDGLFHPYHALLLKVKLRLIDGLCEARRPTRTPRHA